MEKCRAGEDAFSAAMRLQLLLAGEPWRNVWAPDWGRAGSLHVVSRSLQSVQRILVAFFPDKNVVRVVCGHGEDPILLCASMLVIPDSMPIKEKSRIPSILKALQPSSRSVAFSGTSWVRQTSDFSSSVFPMKQNGESRSTSEYSITLQTEKSSWIRLMRI